MVTTSNVRRPKSTGRFETRAEFCIEVWNMYLHSPRKISHIAKLCRVSEATIHTILNTKEGYPSGTT